MEGGAAVPSDDVGDLPPDVVDAEPRARKDHRVHVLIVDDHEGVAESLSLGLESELGSQFGSSRTAGSVATALKAVQESRPDVIVMDVLLGHEDGIDAIGKIHEVDDTIPVLVFTGMADVELIGQANEAGAAAFLTKRAPLWRLASAVNALANHPPDEGSMLLAALPRSGEIKGVPRLTTRQLEVLTLMRGGYDARSIAQQLGVSLNTARSHVKAILAKLGAHSQLEAVARAARLGILRTR